MNGVFGNRAHVTCRKHWTQVFSSSSNNTVQIAVVQNAVRNDHRFESGKDDYVSLWFESSTYDLCVEDIFVFVGEIGVRPAGVMLSGGAWLVNFKVPIGLNTGWYNLHFKLLDGTTSNTVRIPVNTPISHPFPQCDPDFSIVSALDGTTWEANVVHLGRKSSVAVWVAGFKNKKICREMFDLQLSGTSLSCVFTSEVDRRGHVQLNSFVPEGLSKGGAFLQVKYLDQYSNSVELMLA